MRKPKTVDTYEAPARKVVICLEDLGNRYEVNTLVEGRITESKHFDLEHVAQRCFDNNVSADCDKDLTAEELAEKESWAKALLDLRG